MCGEYDESIIKACIDEGLCPPELLPCATTFSAGMSSGCLCGAVGASQIAIGYHYGRNNQFGNPVSAREKAAELLGVADAAEILEELIKVKV